MRSQAGAWERGPTRANEGRAWEQVQRVAFTSRSHPAGVTHGGSLLPSVTLPSFALVPKLQLGNAVLEALLRHPASCTRSTPASFRSSTCESIKVSRLRGREAELPECAFPSWSSGTRAKRVLRVLRQVLRRCAQGAQAGCSEEVLRGHPSSYCVI